MLIAFCCTLTVLPAAITLLRARSSRLSGEAGFTWAAPLDRAAIRARWPILGTFALLAIFGASAAPRIEFDSDPLHTKNPNTEAMRTLADLAANPLTDPYTRRAAGQARPYCRRRLPARAHPGAAHPGRSCHSRRPPPRCQGRQRPARPGRGAPRRPTPGCCREEHRSAAERTRLRPYRRQHRTHPLPSPAIKPPPPRARGRSGGRGQHPPPDRPPSPSSRPRTPSSPPSPAPFPRPCSPLSSSSPSPCAGSRTCCWS